VTDEGTDELVLRVRDLSATVAVYRGVVERFRNGWSEMVTGDWMRSVHNGEREMEPMTPEERRVLEVEEGW